MKRKLLDRTFRSLAAVTLAAGISGIAIAGPTTAAKDEVAKVIDLHAQNNATRSVTIWVPKSMAQVAEKPATARRARVIDLHAPNNSTPSVTIWTPEAKPSTK